MPGTVDAGSTSLSSTEHARGQGGNSEKVKATRAYFLGQGLVGREDFLAATSCLVLLREPSSAGTREKVNKRRSKQARTPIGAAVMT